MKSLSVQVIGALDYTAAPPFDRLAAATRAQIAVRDAVTGELVEAFTIERKPGEASPAWAARATAAGDAAAEALAGQ